jgi:hypothetical protein
MASAATTMQTRTADDVEAKPAESSKAVVVAAERAKVVAAVPNQATQPAAATAKRKAANSTTEGQVATLHRRQQTDVSLREQTASNKADEMFVSKRTARYRPENGPR